jgi:uncharacterized RmlC-like cupin family protein
MGSSDTCVVVPAGEQRRTLQGLTNFLGISATSAGSQGLCLHLVVFAPGERANAHLHEGHETALYQSDGTVGMWFGDGLERYVEINPGDFLYIPAGLPHLPFNTSATETATAVAARTDPNEQESVVLLPQLDELIAARGGVQPPP